VKNISVNLRIYITIVYKVSKMEQTGTIDRDCPLGMLFQQIINEMKVLLLL